MHTPHGLTVFVVNGATEYDFSLGDQISEFGLLLEKEGWSSNILQIPDGDEEDLLTFFDPETSLQVYAKPEPASGQSGTQPGLSGDHFGR
jgi:hypothetical protein